MDDRDKLFETLRKIEALYAGAATPGERDAAASARERIRARLKTFTEQERSEEYRFSMDNPWSRRVFVALLRRYGIEPYRYSFDALPIRRSAKCSPSSFGWRGTSITPLYRTTSWSSQLTSYSSSTIGRNRCHPELVNGAPMKG